MHRLCRDEAGGLALLSEVLHRQHILLTPLQEPMRELIAAISNRPDGAGGLPIPVSDPAAVINSEEIWLRAKRMTDETSRETFSGFRNNFGALRILLAAAVVFSDSFLLGDGVTDADPMKRFNHGQAITGHVAVDLFFIMSGYLVALSLIRDASLPRYFWHRIRRVYPGFILAAVFSFLIVLPLAGGRITPPGHLGVAGDFFYRTLRLGWPTYVGAFHTNPFPEDVNQSLWSIPYGFWCYILAAVLSAMGVLRRPRILAVLLVLAIALGVWALAAHWFPVPRWALATIGYPGMWARLLPMFLSAVLLASVKDRVPVKGWIALGAVAVLAIAAQIPLAWSPMVAIAGAYLLFYTAYTPKVRLWRATAWGDPSYGMYLLSFPMQQMIVRSYTHGVAGRTMSPYLLFAVSLPISLAAGYANWWLVERWLVPRRRANQLVSESASQPTSAQPAD